MKLCMVRTVRLSIIWSLFTVHSAMVYVIQVCRQLSSRSVCSCSKAVYKPVWHIPLLSVQWINSWWWTDELFETCRVSRQYKFVKSVHLVGFITKLLQSSCRKKFVTTQDHMNVKLHECCKVPHFRFIGSVLISVSRKASSMSSELLIKVITWMRIKNVEFISKQQDTDTVKLCRQTEISYRRWGFFRLTLITAQN